MNTITKKSLKAGLIAGIVFAVISVGFDCYDGQDLEYGDLYSIFYAPVYFLDYILVIFSNKSRKSKRSTKITKPLTFITELTQVE